LTIREPMSAKITIRDIQRYQPLDSLNPENIKEIASKLTVVAQKKGEIVVKPGETEHNHVYLHKGKLDVIDGRNVFKKLEADTEETRSALSHIIPHNMTAISSSDVIILKINSDLLDMMLTWDQTGSFQVEELHALPEDEDWMSRILQTEAFRRIPPSNIQAIFTSLEDVAVKPGDAVINQGDPGDYFYIIKSGRCMVSRKMPGQDKEIKLAELKAGDSFGEEALISDSARNASIVMLSDGVLSRLSKQQFLELLKEPMLNQLDYAAAKAKVDSGESSWLDIRLPAEHGSAHIKGCQHIPLIFLRMKVDTLDKAKHYTLYCDTGRRSSSASFLLNERGFTTSVLIDGMKDVPPEDMEGSNIPT
jgi:signal-transduction protein with cAMP-binding, CBS, and nucleotidyltransferase domain